MRSLLKRPLVATAVLSVLVAGGGLAAVEAGAFDASAAPHHDDAVQRSLDGLVDDDQFPGALAVVRGPGGHDRDYAAGVSNVDTGEPMPRDPQLRIASNTKMFTATVVLQLVGEGKIDLDASVETYLPSLVRGDGIDGRQITVRHILQQTSGLADYDEALIGEDYFAVQHTYFEPRELLDATLAQPALFAPGTDWSYSNGNYVLAGLIAQRVTGRPIGEEITKRIIEPLGLRHTYWPELGDQTIDGRHPHGYFPKEDGSWGDVTEQETSLAWAAGQLVGTPSDLNTFLAALLGGELLEPEQLEQMKTTVEAPEFDTSGTARYGLGIATFELSCGGLAWTHGGDAPGYVTRSGLTDDGRLATVAVNGMPTELPAAQHIEKAVDTALCQ